MAHQLASVGLFDATTDAGAKVPILFEQPQSGSLDELFGVGAAVIGDTRKLRFLLGGWGRTRPDVYSK
jgi:hypothetical protein